MKLNWNEYNFPIPGAIKKRVQKRSLLTLYFNNVDSIDAIEWFESGI